MPIGNDAELIFVDSLAAAATEVLATVPTADQPTLRRLRNRLRAQIDDLDQGSVDDQSTTSSTSASALTNLQRRLFKEEEKSKEATPDNTVEVFSAPGEGRECVEIVRRVVSMARSGVALDRITVLLRSPEGYRTYLEEAFNRAGIPAHFARGAVRPDPAGRAFCALLKCAADGLSARRFAEYLSLGQVPDATSDGAPPEAILSSECWVSPDSEFDPSSTEAAEEPQPAQLAKDPADEAPVREGQLRAPRRWERLLVDAAVIGGRDRWRRRIEGLVNDVRLRISELVEEEEAQAAVLARTLEDLTAFAVYAIPLIDLLDSLPKSANWGDCFDKLGALASRARLPTPWGHDRRSRSRLPSQWRVEFTTKEGFLPVTKVRADRLGRSLDRRTAHRGRGSAVDLKGYCHPIRFNNLVETKKATADVLAALPPAESYAKAKFPTLDEQKAAKEVIAKQWDAVVGATVAK